MKVIMSSPVKLLHVHVESNKDILLGTIGYHLLANHSIGPLLIDEIRSLPWAAQVDVQEMNWGPIAIVQKFESGNIHYKRIVFLTAIERIHRKIGELSIFKWGGKLPPAEDIQACVGDAVTGVISSENLLIIGEHFKIWPEEVFLFDVEPGPETAGIELSSEVQKNIPFYFEKLKELCLTGNCEEFHPQLIYGDELMKKNSNEHTKSIWQSN